MLNIPTLHCPKCGKGVVPVISPSGQHLRADCPRGHYLKFLPANHVISQLYKRGEWISPKQAIQLALDTMAKRGEVSIGG